jgi:hypothetical protein
VELPSLDWSTAKVKDGVLTVELSGERPKGWSKTFATTATLLGSGGDWDDVQLKKLRIKVTGVEPGMEERLRFFLEAVVQQADATHRPDDADQDDADTDSEDATHDGEAGDGRSDDPDAELTARFRAFGD